MKNILKTLIESPDLQKWSLYKSKFWSFFKERDPFYDQVLDFIGSFLDEMNVFPTYDGFRKELTTSNESTLLKYVEALEEDKTLEPIGDPSEFASYLSFRRKVFLETDLITTVSQFQNEYASMEVKRTENVIEKMDELMFQLNAVKQKVEHDDSRGGSGLLFGDEAVEEFQEVYDKNKDRSKDSDAFYFDFGLSGFESIKFKAGDLVILGGFMSHGKSVWLRYLIYRLLVHYGQNCVFMSFEMSYEVVRILFQLLHANNKDIFPGTPLISYTKFKYGNLSAEEENFLFSVAAKDLAHNPDYGSLYIEQPSKSRYRLSDLEAKLREIEMFTMPIHAVGVDYLTLMYPLETDFGSPQRPDFNQMIKGFKSMALAHRNNAGKPSPFVVITPVQISRHGLDAAIKAELRYEVAAIREYSEVETSADVIITTLFTDEMRALSKFRLQNLKHRDGVLVQEPIEVFCNMDHGFSVNNMEQRTQGDLILTLQGLDI